MRNLFIVLLLIFAITITGCGARESPESAAEISPDSTSTEQALDTESMTAESDSSSEIADSKPEPVSDEQDSSESNAPAPAKPQPPVVSEQPTPSPPSEQKPEESAPPAEPVQPQEPKAGVADSQAVADKVRAYINQYRAEQGGSAAVKLPGLTRYAEYRSRQLVSNFAHDTDDERAAATALRYGQYIDPPLYGMTGEPYYTVNTREAIAMGGYVGTVDEVAKSLAQLVKNSPNHWVYVGSPEYGFAGVGVTYHSGIWYCDIAMAQENTDEK